jgi:hypothetical protein
MTRFQACVGPSMNKVHIRDTTNPSPLVMCCATTATRNYKGQLAREHLCEKCAREFFARMNEQKLAGGNMHGALIDGSMTALSIGVRELV